MDRLVFNNSTLRLLGRDVIKYLFRYKLILNNNKKNMQLIISIISTLRRPILALRICTSAFFKVSFLM